ncbi:MAG: radical SAM protein [Bdellovibrionota bacterium]
MSKYKLMRFENFRYLDSFYPFKLSWMITTRCNINCNFCFLPCLLRKEEIHSIPVKDVLQWCKKHKIFSLEVFGGEPFLEIDRLIEIIKNTKKGEPYLSRISTNGTIYNKKVGKLLRDLENFQQLQVSLDVSDSNSYFDIKGKDYFDNVINNIKNYVRDKVPVSLSVVLSTQNFHMIVDLIKLAEQLDVKNISFDGMMCNNANSAYHNCHLTYLEMIELKNKLTNMKSSKVKIILNNSYNSKGHNYNNCMAGFTEMTLLPNGDIYPCSLCLSDNDLKLGSIYKGIDKERNEKLKKFLKYRVSSKCRNCELPSICDGACKLVQLQRVKSFYKTIGCDDIGN